MRRWFAFLVMTGTVIGPACLGPACLPGRGPLLTFPVEASVPPPPTQLQSDAGLMFMDVDLGSSFAVVGMSPSHGPFTGGTRAIMTGRGFTSNMVVTIGGTSLASSNTIASDPTQAAVVTPPGAPGPADVTIFDPTTAGKATLPGGFLYDAFVLVPNSGATSGGTRITVEGSGTMWTTGTKVLVAGNACTSLSVLGPTKIQCTTPPGALATVDVDVITPDGTDTKARDAYSYSDSADGYRGGLAGTALAGNLTVLAYDQDTGAPIDGAHVIVGGSIATALVQSTNASGATTFSSPALTGTVTVTVAAKCHQPVTFVAVAVDNATVYLQPVIEPSCGSGDPPSTGNYDEASQGQIQGELVWGSGIEFQRGLWSTVPAPVGKNERQAAYVFLGGGATAAFSLPDASSATTPQSPGTLGYQYTIPAPPGNLIVYALAGIEDRSVTPPVFTAYVMGVARGVAVLPSTDVTGVNIPMDTLLDQAVMITPNAPPPGVAGPDRLASQLAVTLDETTYAVLPNGSQTSFLPVTGSISFIGVPVLADSLSGQSYVYSGTAGSGSTLGVPNSEVSLIETTNSSSPVAVSGFLDIPVPVQPGNGTWDGKHVSFTETSPFDVATIDISSASGLVTWTIVAPAGQTSFDVPDLSGFSDNAGLRHGALQTTLSVASIASFQYDQVVYGQLNSGAWNAYAQNVAAGAY